MTRFQEGIEATAIIKESSKLVLPRLTTEDVNQERAEACCFENPVGSQTDWSLVCVCVWNNRGNWELFTPVGDFFPSSRSSL